MQPDKMTQSGAAAESATMDAVPVRETGMTTAAQRGAAYYNPGMYRELGLPRMGAARGVHILGGLHRSPTNDPGAFAQQPGLGGGRDEDLLGVFRRADAEDLGAVSYNSDSHADKATGVPVAAVGRNKAAAAGALAAGAQY